MLFRHGLCPEPHSPTGLHGRSRCICSHLGSILPYIGRFIWLRPLRRSLWLFFPRGSAAGRIPQTPFSTVFVDPYDAVFIHVIYDSDALIAFPEAGLVHTDPAQPAVDSFRYVRLQAFPGGFDAVSDCAPVDIKVQGDSCMVHLANLIVEFRGEAGCPILPGQLLRANIVPGTPDALRAVADIYRYSIQVRSTPSGLCFLVFLIVSRASFPTVDAPALLILVRSCMDEELFLFVILSILSAGSRDCLNRPQQR